ncbi:MAG: RNA 2',3'-cyclic phosphodiesterase [Candidatus Binatia bacterium]
MPSSGDTLRCFVAIDLPDELRAAVAQAQRALRREAGPADVRWVDPGALHLTLAFLGAVGERQRAPIEAALRALAESHAPLALAAAGLGAFPSPRRARVVWVGIAGGAGALARLAVDVEAALAQLGFPPESRPFQGHVTLGRVRRPDGLSRLAAAIEAGAGTSFGAWTAREIVLYQSRLGPTGAVYVPLAHVPLGPRDA